MPDTLSLLVHPQIGPALSATTWTALPIVGATPMFTISVSRRGSPVSGATVTLRVKNDLGVQVYPPTGALTVPADPVYPGSYTVTASSTAIFSKVGALYTASWVVTVPASGYEPQMVLPITQKVVAQEA